MLFYPLMIYYYECYPLKEILKTYMTRITIFHLVHLNVCQSHYL